MLHKINPPNCTDHLDWIVRFQGDLLRALCNPDVGADDVTPEWVRDVRPDIDDDWMTRFCRWSKGGAAMLDRMRAVATLDAVDKQAILEHYANNLQYPDAFDEAKDDPPPTTPLPDDLPDTVVKVYRDFFEMYYAPIFYRSSTHQGYPIDGDDLIQRFSKSVYLDAYHASNSKVTVCPLCDGSMDGAELDHWLAKKYLPELNCHPLNLVEICPTCNSVTNKGDKLALDTDSAQPFQNWFHPYIRPAIDTFIINIQEGRPKLSVKDAADSQRIENLDTLVNLTRRWGRKVDNLVTRIEERIRHHRRRGRNFNKQILLEQIQSWLTDAQSEIGLGEHKLLETALLSEATDDTSDRFVELLEYAVAAG